jgi:hypothetical protein
MAILLECATEEQCSLVRYLWAKSLNAKDIYKEMFPVSGRKCLSRSKLGGKRFADDEEFETECDNSQKTSVLRVSTHW